MGIAPVFAGAELLIATVVAPHPAGRLVVSRHEAVLVAHAAIVRRLDLVPHDEAVRSDAVFVEADRLDPAADHQPIQPLPGPFDLAFEMAAALGNARRLELARGHGREPGLDEFVLAAAKRQAADESLVEHDLL